MELKGTGGDGDSDSSGEDDDSEDDSDGSELPEVSGYLRTERDLVETRR